MKIQELIQAKVKILSENKDANVMNVSVPWIQADKKNQNGRTYPKSLLQREVARVQSSVKKGSFIGTGDHPFSGLENIATASHIVTSLSLDDEGQGWAEMRILPTDRGKNIQTLIRNGATLGVSARGFGNVAKDGRVSDDYKLVGVDVVTSPSFKNAVFDKSNIFESLDFEEEHGDKELEKEIDKLERESYLNAINAGFKGDQKDWLKNCGSLREAMGLPVEKGTSEVEKLTEETISKKVYSFYQEAVSAGYIGSLNEYKEKFPGIVESASEPRKIVETKKEIKAPVKMKMPLAEARASGFRGTAEDFKEQHPDIELVMPTPLPQKKVVTERALTEKELKEEAARIFAGLSKDNPNSSLLLEDVLQFLQTEEIAKSDKRLRKKAISIVNASLAGSGSAPSQELLKTMVTDEIENLKEKREEMRKRNWECYEKLLSD